MKARLFTDGGARGNPGPAAFGYVLEAEDGTVLAAHGEAIGVATNNVAEYRALVAGLERAAELQVGDVEVVSDSELLVKQMTGEYRVKHDGLKPLHAAAKQAVARLGTVRFLAVRREDNARLIMFVATSASRKLSSSQLGGLSTRWTTSATSALVDRLE